MEFDRILIFALFNPSECEITREEKLAICPIKSFYETNKNFI
jgi:hypothetical protein